MARVVKEQERAVKRKEILDVAQRLVYTKGYEQMSIQDILNELHISKGAFYHYFDSKQALLEALIERRQEEAAQLLFPILQDPQLTASKRFSVTLTLQRIGRPRGKIFSWLITRLVCRRQCHRAP